MANYRPEDIVALTFAQAVRKRAGMYFGDCESVGLTNAIIGAVSHAAEEADDRRLTRIRIALRADGSVTLADDGPGQGLPEVRGDELPSPVVFYAGHMARPWLKGVPKASWRHTLSPGLGAAAAVSRLLVAQVRNPDVWLETECRAGEPMVPAAELPKTSEETGTTLALWPDREIFGESTIETDRFIESCRAFAALVPGFRIEVRDESSGRHEDLHYPGGVVDAARSMLVDTEPLIEAPLLVRGELPDESGTFEVAAFWTAGNRSDVRAATNERPEPRGGSTLRGFHDGLRETLGMRGDAQDRDAPLAWDFGTNRSLVGYALTQTSNGHRSQRGDLRYGELRDAVRIATRDAVEAHVAAHGIGES